MVENEREEALFIGYEDGRRRLTPQIATLYVDHC